MILHKIQLDMQSNITKQVMYAKQEDSMSRTVQIELYNGGTEWPVPEKVTILQIAYSKPDRTGGVYDTLPNGSKACTAHGNRVECKLHPQMFTVAGKVYCEFRMLNEQGLQLATFYWVIFVEASVTEKLKSEDYFNFASLSNMREEIGILADLKTKAKRDLVAAINELRDCATTLAKTVNGVSSDPDTGDVRIIGEDIPAFPANIPNFEGSVDDALDCLGLEVFQGQLGTFKRALTDFSDSDLLGLPVLDPDAEEGYSPMQIGKRDGEKGILTVPTADRTKEMIRKAVLYGYIDVTEDYEKALEAGTVACAKEYLWTLGEGRYSLVDGTEKYYLGVFVGELFGEERRKNKRILLRVGEFLNLEIHSFSGAYTRTPDIMIDGETGHIYQNGRLFRANLKQTDPRKNDYVEGRELMGDLGNLETKNKDSLVDAINEVAKSGGNVDSAVSKNHSYFSLPDNVVVKVGNEFKIYFRNIISLKTAQLWVGSNDNLTTRFYEEYLSITPTKEGSHTLSWRLFDDNCNLLKSGTLTIIATTKTAHATSNVLVIGDSTVNAGVMTQKAMDLFTADGATLSLLGTRGTSPNLHEGRGGWAAFHYCTKDGDGTYTNPFYNNGFDFSHYMHTQGYSGLQVVVIQLGINDIFRMTDETYSSEQVLGYLEQMVESIHSYDSSIKIVLNLPTTPNSNNVAFTETYGTSQIYWLYNRNIIRFAEEYKEYFKDYNYVTISASNCVLDTEAQIRDGVHPTTEGYHVLGQRLYEVLIDIVDGVAVSLLFVNRPYIVNTSTTITAAMPHELDFTKCYATNYKGIRGAASAREPYELISENSLSYTTTEQDYTSGRGIEFPVDLEVGKTYELSYTANETNARVYLLKYNADTTFNSNTLLDSAKGDITVTITPEEGFIYSIMFTPVFAGRGVWTNIELIEKLSH